MSPYRASTATNTSPRWHRALSVQLTHVRIWPDKVAIDAPDFGALIVVFLATQVVLPFAFVDFPRVALAILGLLAILLSVRVHLRVREGRATLVRTVLGLPWAIYRRAPDVMGSWIDWDLDGTDLVLPPGKARPNAARIVVLTTSLNAGLTDAEIDEVAAAIELLFRESRVARNP